MEKHGLILVGTTEKVSLFYSFSAAHRKSWLADFDEDFAYSFHLEASNTNQCLFDRIDGRGLFFFNLFSAMK